MSQFREIHRYEEIFFLFRIDELDEAALDKRIHVYFLLLKPRKVLFSDKRFAIF